MSNNTDNNTRDCISYSNLAYLDPDASISDYKDKDFPEICVNYDPHFCGIRDKNQKDENGYYHGPKKTN